MIKEERALEICEDKMLSYDGNDFIDHNYRFFLPPGDVHYGTV